MHCINHFFREKYTLEANDLYDRIKTSRNRQTVESIPKRLKYKFASLAFAKWTMCISFLIVISIFIHSQYMKF